MRDLAELAGVLGRVEFDDNCENLVTAALHSVRYKGASIFFIGNGGSSAIASHMAIDWLNKANVSAYALNDGAALTCLANDYGYEEVFLRQLQRHAGFSDVLVAISSSGKSQNIVRAAEWFRQRGSVMTLTGFAPDNPLRQLGNINFYVPSEDYGIVETAHLGILHALLDKVAA
jgi:D-sedoheptulose 7-phosphate isomerase